MPARENRYVSFGKSRRARLSSQLGRPLCTVAAYTESKGSFHGTHAAQEAAEAYVPTKPSFFRPPPGAAAERRQRNPPRPEWDSTPPAEERPAEYDGDSGGLSATVGPPPGMRSYDDDDDQHEEEDADAFASRRPPVGALSQSRVAVLRLKWVQY